MLQKIYYKLWSGRSKKCRYVTYFILADVFVVIGLIILGLVTGLRQPSDPVSVIVPLYLYPSEGAWDPLYTAYVCLLYSNSRLKAYPSLQFLVIINPDNGPGNGTLLDKNFQQQLPILNSMGNVMTLGYVTTNYTSRNINEVFDDIGTYALWSGNGTSNFTLHGIFLDETPSSFTEESSEFMNRTDGFIKQQTGFGGVNFVLSFPRIIC
jgi:hypothetical protein